MDNARSRRALERLTLEVIERLRTCCSHLPEEELILLATDIASIELKYLGHASTTLGERKPVNPKS